MSEINTEQTEIAPPPLPEGRLLSFESIKNALSDIQVGDTITDFANLDEYDQLACALPHARLTLPQRSTGQSSTIFGIVRPHRLTSSGSKVYAGWRNNVQRPSQQLVPKKVNGQTFNGKVIDLSVTLLSENVARKETGYPDHHAGNQVVVGLHGRLRSTGRGVIGEARKLLIATDTETGFLPQIKYVDVGDDINAAFEHLVDESAEAARKLTVNGLRKAFSAGLPGSGKRH
jgi:hypothetical protein